MKIEYRNTIIVVLLIVLSFSLGFNISKPEKAIGMATNYDKNAAVATLKALDTELAAAGSTISSYESDLMKYSYQIPDPIYSDLMSEFRRNTDGKDKMHYLQTMIYAYIKSISQDANYKKTYRFSGSGDAKTRTQKFFLFHGVKKFKFTIKGTPKNNNKQININLMSVGLSVLRTHKITKNDYGEKTYDVIFTDPLNASMSSPMQCIFDIDPHQGTTSWSIEFTDQ